MPYNLIKLLEAEVGDIPMGSLKVRRHLDRRIWRVLDGQYRLNPEVRDKMLAIANYFVKTLDLAELGIPSIPIDDMIFTGSLANYNWSRYSDVDIHIRVDLSNISDRYRPLLKEYAELRKKMFAANQDIHIFEYDVELYMEPVDEPGIALGVYSIKDDKWLKFPDRHVEMLDFNTIKKKTLAIMNSVDAIGRSIDSGMVDNEKALGELRSLWKRIKNMRRAGLEREGEFSTENLVFKLLRRNGYIAKIIDMRAGLIDKKLSYGT